MTSKLNRIYWDSTAFLCFLRKHEGERRGICEDILYHARGGHVSLYTSTFTITEVIRPRNGDVKGARHLTPEEVAEIEGMFQWPWLKKIDVDQRVARRAVELSRDYGLSPADSIHAASALVAQADVLQHWDRQSGFVGLERLIPVENPRKLSYG